MSEARNLCLLVQYDGTDFLGWQAQAEGRTVQGVLSEGLRKLLGGETVTLYGSSRTDSGVHAQALPVSFWTKSTLPLKAFVFGLNSILPDDVRILQARDVPPWFHARFSALSKTYVYSIQTGPVTLPLYRRTHWHVPQALDVSAMSRATSYILGEHDFSSFRAAHCDAVSPVRNVFRCDVATCEDGVVRVTVKANGFLRHMVRIIVGTLVHVGLGKQPPEWVESVLKGRDRRLAGPTAPAKGLTLVSVDYPELPPKDCFPNPRTERNSG